MSDETDPTMGEANPADRGEPRHLATPHGGGEPEPSIEPEPSVDPEGPVEQEDVVEQEDAAEQDDAVDPEDAADPVEDDALLSRLRLIESQPLQERAAAFGQLHDELSAVLEGSDGPGDRD